MVDGGFFKTILKLRVSNSWANQWTKAKLRLQNAGEWEQYMGVFAKELLVPGEEPSALL